MTTFSKHHLILGIETSCDETAAAVYDPHKGVLANCLFSQTALHKKYGGVVPEIASRSHIEKMGSIVHEALATAGCSLDDISTIGVTNNPGLAGSLLVGLCFAKGLAYGTSQTSLTQKLIGINHLEGHIYSACIEHAIPFPFICLTASGGHTSLYYVRDFWHYELLGTTLDDAAGEAFDKVSKLLELGYPGGPIIEQLAQAVNFEDFFHYPRLKKKNLSLSFSGLKTAVLYDLVNRGAYDLATKKFRAQDDLVLKQQVASSLLVCIKDIFIDRLKIALEEYPQTKSIAFVGGVACNTFLRKKLGDFAQKNGRQLFCPSLQYCTDNAAMIAFVASKKMERGEYNDLSLDIFE